MIPAPLSSFVARALLVAGLLTALVLAACGEPPQPTTNLYRAVHSGDLDQIKRHLFWGTDVNQPGPDGRYPLQVAVADGRVVIARELLDHGASMDVRDQLGHTPLYVALANGRVPAAELLMERGARDDPQVLLRQLVVEDRLDRDTLALLVSRGVDLNALGPEGLAPLHQAVANDNLKMTKWLLQEEADVNLVTDSGATALDLALAAEADPNLILLLQQYGAQQ
ncbi:ankyrin repeat domain-containing protein [Thiorhodovibrio frisius]|uniref:Ankyrin repeat-containing protein n=1 Tax=Thiorhodovibrio frisius TaxID=631362 RepID=H8Z614_9GAMM|nr:ankyrin repeat domain-containing protein [Thiorhodovibrio frisius]EIC20664.1 ankyrin repeat-containing protein [Thiorhodovibrio frisius]WPL21412.1 ankyrin repeat protein [Thiorhodovibrio frisius]